MTSPCTYCGKSPCPTPAECAKAAAYLERHDKGMRRLYLDPLPIRRAAA